LTKDLTAKCSDGLKFPTFEDFRRRCEILRPGYVSIGYCGLCCEFSSEDMVFPYKDLRFHFRSFHWILKNYLVCHHKECENLKEFHSSRDLNFHLKRVHSGAQDKRGKSKTGSRGIAYGNVKGRRVFQTVLPTLKKPDLESLRKKVNGEYFSRKENVIRTKCEVLQFNCSTMKLGDSVFPDTYNTLASLTNDYKVIFKDFVTL